jgi:hypothetical protein
VLRHFYNRTLPFGLWSPDCEQLPADLRRRVAAEHRREIAALPLALLFQTAAFMTPMLAIIRNWEALTVSAGVTAIAFAGLYLVWLRRIDESDAIVAEALLVLPDSGPMQVVTTPTVTLGGAKDQATGPDFSLRSE